MSYEEFYEKDVYLVKIYRKMDKIREEKKNAEMWIQGMYIYEAISTTLYNMFAKKAGQSSMTYPSKPYGFEEKSKEEKEKEEQAKAQVWMNNLVNAYK